MTTFLLAVHVLAVILAVGPVAVAASMFPAVARRTAGAVGTVSAADRPTIVDQGGDPSASLRLLHRICRVYATAAVAVPVFGIATASSLGVLADPWVLGSFGLTVVAASVLVLVLLPGQAALLGGPVARLGGAVAQPSRLAMATGGFNLLWAAVTVLMITRPGSTLGH